MRLAASNILRLLFVDETEASTMMARLMAVQRMAALCLRRRAQGEWHDGADGPRRPHGDPACEAYVTHALAPTVGPGDLAARDNLAADKRAGVGSAIETAGAELPYLALYSADLNLIDTAFAKPQARLRKTAA